jgi:hypothetical protein
MEPVIHLEFRISKYRKWDSLIHENARAFYNQYSVYPNLMIAALASFDKIDRALNHYSTDKATAKGVQFFPDSSGGGLRTLSSYIREDYSLEFCVDNSLPEDHFLLVFDEEPVFIEEMEIEGEDEPEEED